MYVYMLVWITKLLIASKIFIHSLMFHDLYLTDMTVAMGGFRFIEHWKSNWSDTHRSPVRREDCTHPNTQMDERGKQLWPFHALSCSSLPWCQSFVLTMQMRTKYAKCHVEPLMWIPNVPYHVTFPPCSTYHKDKLINLHQSIQRKTRWGSFKQSEEKSFISSCSWGLTPTIVTKLRTVQVHANERQCGKCQWEQRH